MQVSERNGKLLHTTQIRLIIKYVRMIAICLFQMHLCSESKERALSVLFFQLENVQ